MNTNFTLSTATTNLLSFQSPVLKPTYEGDNQMPTIKKSVPVVTKKVFISRYEYDKVKNTCKWMLLTEEAIAKQMDQDYEQASIEDLYHWMAATNEVFKDEIFTVIEGNVKWIEFEYVDFCGKTDWKCGYEIIWD